MYAEYNNNPQKKRVGDCVIRAIAKAMGKDWNEVYIDLSMEGYKQADSLQSMAVWGKYLKDTERRRRGRNPSLLRSRRF